MLDTSIQVKTDRFEGPLGLLLLLVQKEEMDIRSLNLTVITRQYLEYLAQMKELNFDVAGDYLYMAATLLLLKSKNCISEEDAARLRADLDEGDTLGITSQAELVRRLEELQRFQMLGQKLWTLPKLGQDIFVRPRIDRKAIANSILTPMDLEKLTTSMMEIIQKEKKKYSVVKRDRLSIKEKLEFLKHFLKKGSKAQFEEIVDQGGPRDVTNIIVTFISILELARLSKVSVFQNDDEQQSNIYVEVIDSLEDFDINQATGFADESSEKNKTEVTDGQQ